MTDRCRVYWGSHGCKYERGHDGLCECECAYDAEGNREPRVDADGVLNVGAPPYYGRETTFYGDDAASREEALRSAIRWANLQGPHSGSRLGRRGHRPGHPARLQDHTLSCWLPFVTRSEFRATVHDLEERIARMASQADVDALTTEVQQVASDLDAARTALQSEIDQLAASNPAVDLTALQNAVAPLDAAVVALGQLKPDTPAA